jgi:hypothetical protein
MLFDIDGEINERRYLLLMFGLQASEAKEWVSASRFIEIASLSLGSEVDSDELLSLYYLGLIRLLPEEGKTLIEASSNEFVGIENKGVAVLINAAPRFLDQIITNYDVPDGATAALVPLLDVTRVPAADRYVSTADNQDLFATLATELDNVKNELVRDQNANELPIPVQNKRAMVAELDGLIGQIRAGYVRLSDLTQRARPLVKNVADTCKDMGAIAGFAYAAYEVIGKILAALF